jgi:glycosyltransferase involved in cell wall biosynthesis
LLMKYKIRVALGSVFPLDETIIDGGVEAVAYYLAQGLMNREDIELHIVSCNSSISNDFTEHRDNIVIHWIKVAKSFHNLRVNSINMWKVREVYRKIRPDIVHAQGFTEYAMAVESGQNLLLAIHGIEAISQQMKSTHHFRGLKGIYRRWTGNLIISKSIKHARGIISNAGDYTLAFPRLIKGKKIFYIANPIAPEFFHIERDYIVKNNVINLLWVGTISERKNVISLINTHSKILLQHPNVHLALVGHVGENWYYQKIKQVIRELHLENHVQITGPVDNEKLLEHYAEADIFVFPSIEESAPMAIAQAMSTGLPVIASRVGGIPWMLDGGKAGILAFPNDPDEWNTDLSELINSREKRIKFGMLSRERAESLFASDVVVRQTVEAYQKLQGGKDYE